MWFLCILIATHAPSHRSGLNGFLFNEALIILFFNFFFNLLFTLCALMFCYECQVPWDWN